MGTLIEWVAICFAPTILIKLGMILWHRLDGGVNVAAPSRKANRPSGPDRAADRDVDGRERVDAADALDPAGRPPSLSELTGTLRRLREEYEAVERSVAIPAKRVRLTALSLAYDDTLRACCARVGAHTASRSPLSAIDRLEAEAALATHGLTW